MTVFPNFDFSREMIRNVPRFMRNREKEYRIPKGWRKENRAGRIIPYETVTRPSFRFGIVANFPRDSFDVYAWRHREVMRRDSQCSANRAALILSEALCNLDLHGAIVG